MDIATIIGVIAGIGAVIFSIMLGGSLSWFVNKPGLMIVIGGTIAATLITFPLGDVLKVFSVLKNAFFASSHSPIEQITTLSQISEQARRQGLLALEETINSLEDETLKTGLQFAVDGMDSASLRNLMETDLIYLEERHAMGQDLFNTMAKYAPAFGMIGTLIGLVQMLQNMDDPTTIGPAMAVALLTTFYGAVLANLLFIPIAGKLKQRSQEESLMRQILIEGTMLIQDAKSAREVENSLKSFLPPKMRVNLQGVADGAAAD